jgi:hypothetical protein
MSMNTQPTTLTLARRVEAFVQLGQQLKNLPEAEKTALFQSAEARNPWFTTENLHFALEALQHYLDAGALQAWLQPYLPLLEQARTPLPVGVVMAGNIPAVGFHDLLCVLLSGHKLLAKLSSDDEVLMRYLIDRLCEIEPAFKPLIELPEFINQAAAYIATGSNHANRYFKHYFGKKPHILRGHRNAVAILDGNETIDDFLALGKDIFRYFGLGCRNVSKLYVPRHYDFQALFEGMEAYRDIINHHKYANNYEYNKAVFLVKPVPHLDNGFLLLREAAEIASPVAVLHYEYYDDAGALQEELQKHSAAIQCMLSRAGTFPGTIPFGEAQNPRLSDYADGIDTMQFLLTLSA